MRIWKCDVCRKVGPWVQGKSAIYGSILTEEEGIPQFYTCSDSCRSKVKMPEDWRVKVEALDLDSRMMKIFDKSLSYQGKT